MRRILIIAFIVQLVVQPFFASICTWSDTEIGCEVAIECCSAQDSAVRSNRFKCKFRIVLDELGGIFHTKLEYVLGNT